MTDTPLTDDYVAELLKKDASRKDQNRYLSNSLGGLLSSSSRPRSNAAKPNTRFLRNLVRDADSHNAALRRKEEEESRARLRKLRREGEQDKKPGHDERGGRRRREGLSPRERHHKRERSRDRERREKRNRSRSKERSRSRSRSPRRERHHSHSHSHRERERKRSRSPDRKHISRSNYASRHRSPRDQDSDSDTSPPQRKSTHPTKPTTTNPSTTHRSPSPSSHSASDSDPLSALLGPKPPSAVLPRGRGAHNHQNSTSNIDTRFSASYDPKTDISPPHSENDDWDAALEAFRDRAKWKQSSGERLLAAGFTEEEVARSQMGTGGKGRGEGDVESVKWRKRGEGREWDRGKVVEGEFVDLRPSWGNGEGRLKGT